MSGGSHTDDLAGALADLAAALPYAALITDPDLIARHVA